jgi:transposase
MSDEALDAQIHRLAHEGWPIGTIAVQLGLHHSSVRRVLKGAADASARGARPWAVDPYVDFIRATLQQYPTLTASRIHEMLRSRGFGGSAIQVRRVIRERDLRPKAPTEAFFRLRMLPGEQAQVDWAHLGRMTVGSIERPVWGLVVVLSYSRALHVFFSHEQAIGAVLRGHVEALEHFGGVPRKIAYDNMKTVVLERAGDVIRFHPHLLELCTHYVFEPIPCRPRRPTEKGRVERAIRYLRDSFLPGRLFADLDDYRTQFAQWRQNVAYARSWPDDRARNVIDAIAEERPYLQTLPLHAFDTDVARAVVARKQPYVCFGGNRYSIPAERVGRALTLSIGTDRIRVIDRTEVIAEHERCWDRNQTLEKRAHLDGLLETKPRARTLQGRARLIRAVPIAEVLLQKLARDQEMLGPQVTQLLRLLDGHGPHALDAAIEQAIERGTPRASSVAWILRREENQTSPKSLPAEALPDRPGVREAHVSNHTLENYDALRTRNTKP